MEPVDQPAPRSWLRQLGSFLRTPAPPAGVEAAAAGVPPAAASAITAPPHEILTQQSQQQKKHLVVMVHGLFGHRANWRAIAAMLEASLDPADTLLFVSTANERQKVGGAVLRTPDHTCVSPLRAE